MNQQLLINSVSIKATISSPFKAEINFCPYFALICSLDESTLPKFKANQQIYRFHINRFVKDGERLNFVSLCNLSPCNESFFRTTSKSDSL